MSLPSYAYEVWLGCTKIPKSSIDRPEAWTITQKGITGTNVNIGGLSESDLLTPIGSLEESIDGYTRLINQANWNSFFSLLNPLARKGMDPLARTTFYSPDALSNDRFTLKDRLDIGFKRARDNGFEVGYMLPYANSKEDPEDGVGFSGEELRQMRHYLDSVSPFVKIPIIENKRAYYKDRFWAQYEEKSAYIDAYLLEAEPEKFYNDRGNRQTLLRILLNDEKFNDKLLIFQLPQNPNTAGDEATHYDAVRKFIVWLGDNYGREFLKSNRVKFLITAYSPAIPFLPELNDDGSRYKNTITGIIASLIEQEPLFSGRLKNADGTERIPTNDDAVNTLRDVSAITGVNNFKFNNSMSVYPNPNTTGTYNLSKPASWTLYDSYSRFIKKGEGTEVIIENQNSGFYFIQTENEILKIILN